MNPFQARRVAHEYTQTNPAAPEMVFPLLCPVREADWIPGWRYQLLYSESGVAELGCTFTTEDSVVESEKYSPRGNTHLPGTNGKTSPTTTWICVDYDPAAFRIAYVWIKPGRVATELRIQLSAAENGETHSHTWFRYTGLSPEGNLDVDSYDRAWFEAKMRGWETAINHYLNTGEMIAA